MSFVQSITLEKFPIFRRVSNIGMLEFIPSGVACDGKFASLAQSTKWKKIGKATRIFRENRELPETDETINKVI